MVQLLLPCYLLSNLSFRFWIFFSISLYFSIFRWRDCFFFRFCNVFPDFPKFFRFFDFIPIFRFYSQNIFKWFTPRFQQIVFQIIGLCGGVPMTFLTLVLPLVIYTQMFDPTPPLAIAAYILVVLCTVLIAVNAVTSLHSIVTTWDQEPRTYLPIIFFTIVNLFLLNYYILIYFHSNTFY